MAFPEINYCDKPNKQWSQVRYYVAHLAAVGFASITEGLLSLLHSSPFFNCLPCVLQICMSVHKGMLLQHLPVISLCRDMIAHVEWLQHVLAST